MKIVVCGLGYMGTTTAACLMKDGHRVAGVDVDPAKHRAFVSCKSPVHEPGIEELLNAARIDGRILDGATIADHIEDADAIMVCVGTPPGHNGSPDLSQVLAITDEIGIAMKDRPFDAGVLMIVYRCTMLPGSMEKTVIPALAGKVGPPGERYEVAYYPEFLREGTAVQDYFTSPRIVVGERIPGGAKRLNEIYRGIDAPVFEVPMAVAEMSKYVDNGFHALKVAFANELGRLAEALSIPVRTVTDIFLADGKLNLSSAYLRPGGAFGGSCLPKDVGALTACFRENDVRAPIMENVLNSNDVHKEFLAEYASAHVPRGGHILLLGLTFKTDTDDLRESPLVDLAESLMDKGFRLTIHDPDLRTGQSKGVNLNPADTRLRRLFALLTDDPEGALGSADLVVIGKRMPALADRLAGNTPSVDLYRL